MNNAVAPTRSDPPASEPTKSPRTTAADRRVRPQESTSLEQVPPLSWLVRAWALLIVTALLTQGTSVGLRGAFVGVYSWSVPRWLGATDWFSVADALTAFAAQSAAMATNLLLIYLGLLCIRTAKNVVFGTLAAALGAGPALVLVVAHRHNVYHFMQWVALSLAGGAIVVCASQAMRNKDVKRVLAFAGATLVLSSTRLRAEELHYPPALLNGLGALEVGAQWTTLALVVWRFLRLERSRPWVGASWLGVGVLTGAISNIPAGEAAVPTTLLRMASALTPQHSLTFANGFAFGLTLSGTLWCAVRKSASLTQLSCCLLALALFTPATPLSAAWSTACAFFAVVVSWSPDRPSRLHR